MKGRFGRYGGQFVAETLMAPLEELEEAFSSIKVDHSFDRVLQGLLTDFVGRPTPLTPLSRLVTELGGAKIYLKREDLAHTGAHKINNTLGQGLLATRMGKRRVVADTGAGQHGVATATACALLDLECVVYMGAVDALRQAQNVRRMELLGADVRVVTAGTQTLKDAITTGIQDWITNVRSTYYLLGSVIGPHPYPQIVRYFQSVIGRECRGQLMMAERRLPDVVIACVGGGSNSIGIFSEFLDDPEVSLIGVEAAGEGIQAGRHAAPLIAGTAGVLHGSNTYVMQDREGQILETHSIAPGLDYPGVGPEHSYLKDVGRVSYVAVTDIEALTAFQTLSRAEGIIPALEPAHAMAKAIEMAPRMTPEQIVVVNLSGRGDKDLDTALEALSNARSEVA